MDSFQKAVHVGRDGCCGGISCGNSPLYECEPPSNINENLEVLIGTLATIQGVVDCAESRITGCPSACDNKEREGAYGTVHLVTRAQSIANDILGTVSTVNRVVGG